ncbi:MAG: hypothetical protein H7A09_05290 [Oceanospirillaceae bacterium]|nr:hypothetical protein [Oceanospirillaceae bacterium]MCP5334141.1 hypothetical protein [Oceanospirillaceae bacterium]
MRDLNFLMLLVCIAFVMSFLWLGFFRNLFQSEHIVRFFSQYWGEENHLPGILNDWQLLPGSEHIHFKMPSRELGYLKYYPPQSSIARHYVYFYNAHQRVSFADGYYGEAVPEIFECRAQPKHYFSDLGEYRFAQGPYFCGLLVKDQQCIQVFRLPFFYKKAVAELQAQFFR